LSEALTNDSLNSDEINHMLQAASVPCVSNTFSSASMPNEWAGPSLDERLDSCHKTESQVRRVSASSGGNRLRARSSSDQARPLWSSVIKAMDSLSARLVLEGDCAEQRKAALVSFFELIMPLLAAVGPVGLLAQQRLAVMMSEVGITQNVAAEPSEEEFRHIVSTAMAAVKRYASSAMVAPVVAPRSRRQAETAPVAAAALASGDDSARAGSDGPDWGFSFEELVHEVHRPNSRPTSMQFDEPPMLSVLEGTSAEAGSSATTPKIHACKNCQRAKTACMDQRPCARCIRLAIPCDNEVKAVKRACANCKRAKVKCNLDDENPCKRCKRLGVNCSPHVAQKKKMRVDGDAAAELFAEPLPLKHELSSEPDSSGMPLGLGDRFDITDIFTEASSVDSLGDGAGANDESASGSSSLGGLHSGDHALLVPLADVLSDGRRWKVVHQEGNVRVRRPTDGRLWGTATDVPAPPCRVAEGLRSLFRNWGTDDGLVQTIDVVCEGGGVPGWISNCAMCFEQVLHVKCGDVKSGAESLFDRFFEPRDFVLRSVWSLKDGQHLCSIRPTEDDAAPPQPGFLRSTLAIDVFVLPNQEEPDGSLVYTVIDPGELNSRLLEYNHKRLMHWTRRAQEAAMMLHRSAQ